MEANTQKADARPEPMIGRWPRRRVLVLGAAALYIAATVLYAVITGNLIMSRDVVFTWMLVGLLILSLNDVRGWLRGFLFDWLPFFAILWVYDFTRSLAKHSPFPVHSTAQIRFDELIHNPIPTIWLQRHFYHPPAAMFHDYVAWLVYLTHFFATVLVAAYLWKFAYPHFRRWRTVVLWLSAAGMVTYVLYPADPPWLAAMQGHIGHVEQIVPQMFRHTNISAVHSLAEQDFANQVAAVPSLHAAFPMLMLLFFWSSGWKARIPFGLYTLAMGTVLVYTAEHFVADILIGWLYALGVWFGVSWWWRREERKKAEKAAAETSEPPGRAPPATAPEREPAVTYSVAPESPGGPARS
jgi:hypothetical protein